MAQLKKLVEDVGYEFGRNNESEQKKQLTMRLGEFADKVKRFTEIGKSLYSNGQFQKMAEELSSIAENAEAYVMKEAGGEWFDGVTIKRNMGELKKYVSEFMKVAKEAQGLNHRMTALYEDSGRVLSRYFEIQDGIEGGGDMGTTDSEAGKQVGRPNQPSMKMEGDWMDSTTTDYERVDTHDQALKRKASIEKRPNTIGNAQIKQKNGKYYVVFKTKAGVGESITTEAYGDERDSYELRAQHAKEDNTPSPATGDTAKHRGDDRASRYQHYVDTHKKMGQTPKYKSYSDWSAHVDEATVQIEAIQTRLNNRIRIMSRLNPDERLAAHRLNEADKKRLATLREDVNDEYPTGDWTKLDVPALKYEQGVAFEKFLKKEGFKVLRKDLKERTGWQTEFCEFFVPLKEFNEANAIAVKSYKDYDIQARNPSEKKVEHY